MRLVTLILIKKNIGRKIELTDRKVKFITLTKCNVCRNVKLPGQTVSDPKFLATILRAFGIVAASQLPQMVLWAFKN